MSVIYVAIPYSHPSKKVREYRFELANQYAALLMNQGHIVFSPISHSHPISRYLKNANNSDFYVNQDLYWLQFCDEIHVIATDGWENSKGVARELKEAKKLNLKTVKVNQ